MWKKRNPVHPVYPA